MASRNSLSDWEDVGDDNLSVISFSTAEPEADAASTTSTSDDDGTPADLETAQNGASILPTTPTPELQSHTLAQPLEVSEDEHNHPPTQELDKAEEDNPVTDSVDELNQRLEDTELESELDPLLLHRTLESLRDILEDAVKGFGDIIPCLPDAARWKSLGVCNLLSRQVDELFPVTSGYARAGSGLSEDLPIDPNLHGWLTGVRVKVLSLKAEIQSISRSSPNSSPLNLVPIWYELDDYQRKMMEFLPIIQVDFNEFQTKNMNIPIASSMPDNGSTGTSLRSAEIDRSDPIDIPQSNTSAPSPDYTEDFRGGPSNQVWLLRHELYRLKDLIQQTRERLSYTRGLSDSGAGLAADISARYKKLYDTLGTALSNHGSDWIESSLAGGLTYPEFLGLDADCIRDFTCQLRSMIYGLPTDKNETWSSEWGVQLERLEILVMVLSATIAPSID